MKGIDSATGRSHRRKDRSGTRNGRLVFVREVGIDDHKHSVWLGICDCGKKTETATPHNQLCNLRPIWAAENLRKRDSKEFLL